MRFSNFIREITISNEYVSEPNKQIESSNHGQSKLKFKTNSPFFHGFEQNEANNRRGQNPTQDNFTFSGKICFYKKHMIRFFENIKCIYEDHAEDYKRINLSRWQRYYDKFMDIYRDYNNEDLIVENLTTTNYRNHEQALVFRLYQEIIFMPQFLMHVK